MKFKLNVSERLNLLSILPKENNFINLKVINEAISSLGLNDKELIELEVKQEGDRIRFNVEKGIIEKEIEIGERAYTLICEELEKLDNSKKLTQQHFPIYKKFIEDKK